MKIKKKLNNNVAVVTDKTGNKIIVMRGKELLMTRKQETVLNVETS